MSLFNFPTHRLSYPSVGNPVYVSDIQAANELTLDGLTALTDLPNPGFAIISGLKYAGGQYSQGVVWLNGTFFYSFNVLTEGLYLSPVGLPLLNKPFSDTNSRFIYSEFRVGPSSNPESASPLFVGDMNAYRIGLTDLKNEIATIEAELLTLGNAAFKNVGTAAGTVAAGDDPRLVGPLSFFDNRYAQKVNVIQKGDAPGYIPVTPGDPVNKAYADRSVQKLASGVFAVGNVGGTTGTTLTVPIGLNVGRNDYIIAHHMHGAASNPYDDCSVFWVFRNETNISFDIVLFEARPDTQVLTLKWTLIAP